MLCRYCSSRESYHSGVWAGITSAAIAVHLPRADSQRNRFRAVGMGGGGKASPNRHVV